MITIELENVIYRLPESAREVAGTCRSYDPPTDEDGGCLRLWENQCISRLPTRQQEWIHCATNPHMENEGKCPFTD